MCVGIKVEEPLTDRNHCVFGKPSDSQCGTGKQKRRNNEERKEKAKDAARNRRTEESDYFEELEKLLPVTGPPPSSQQTTLDKTSVIRLSVAHLKTQDVLQNGIPIPMVKEEIFPEIDLFSCLDGFSLILSTNGDVIYVSDNVSRYIGLTQVELLGQDFSDYVHPCDHNQLKALTPGKSVGSEDEAVEIFVRVKCTVTERGRMINLKQASYKPLKISGKARRMKENEVGGVTGTIFIGLARCVVEREVVVDNQIGVFTTKHSVDMTFMETNQWMASVAGYSSSKLIGISFFELVHAQDIMNVQKAFKNLKECGQCETSPYRLLCYGGGYAWVQTKACLATARRGCNKGQTISCSHQQISEVMNKDEILSIIQMKKTTFAPSEPHAIETQVVKTDISMKTSSVNNKEDKLGFARFSAELQIQDRAECGNILFEAPEPVHFEITEPMSSIVINVPSIQKSVIIEPRQIHRNDHPAIKADNDNKEVSAKTSVIVKCRQPQPEFTTIPLIQKPIEAFEDKEGQKLKTATEGLWKKDDAVAIATQALFSGKELTYDTVVSVDSLDVIETFPPVQIIQEEDQVQLKETDFFEDLFSNLEELEQFAPHSGGQCISINKEATEVVQPSIETVSFDDMIMLNFDDDFDLSTEFGGLPSGKQNESSIRDFMIPINQQTYDENRVLIDPNRNAMWGSGKDEERQLEQCDVDQPGGMMPVHSLRAEDEQRKGNNFGTSPQPYPELYKIMMEGCKKQNFERNPDVDFFEPPSDKPLCRPKMERSSLKRISLPQYVEQYPMTKRFKPNVNSVINHVGLQTMNRNFDTTSSDIDIVTIL